MNIMQIEICNISEDKEQHVKVFAPFKHEALPQNDPHDGNHTNKGSRHNCRGNQSTMKVAVNEAVLDGKKGTKEGLREGRMNYTKEGKKDNVKAGRPA